MLKFFSKKINNKKGFTLVELIVVIAILGILAAVAVPKLGGFTDSAKQKVAVANEKMVNNMISMYYADYGVYPVTDNTFVDLLNVLEAEGYIDSDTVTNLQNEDESWNGQEPGYTSSNETITLTEPTSGD